MYKKVDTNLDFVQREKEVEKFWKENKIFEKSIEERKGGKPYVFYDGPPTANGKPHIGHVLTRVIKDMIPRYQTMKGNMVPRKAGWDTHGLPVELEVEKLLGLDGKEQIEVVEERAEFTKGTTADGGDVQQALDSFFKENIEGNYVEAETEETEESTEQTEGELTVGESAEK